MFLGDLDDYLNFGKGQKLWQPHLLHQPNKILGFDNILVFGQRPKVVATSSSSSNKQDFGL
jgi:hypothetical protein